MPTRKIIVSCLLLSFVITLASFKSKGDKQPEWKNVQFFPKDVSNQLMMDVMENYCTSLGVECTHCHVEGNMASDDKIEKSIARKMMTMTNEINATYFGKNSGTIGCMTCHNGKTHP